MSQPSVDLVDETAIGPLLEDEKHVVREPQEFRRRGVGEAIVPAEQRHQRQTMQPAAYLVLDFELVLLTRQAQQTRTDRAAAAS